MSCPAGMVAEGRPSTTISPAEGKFAKLRARPPPIRVSAGGARVKTAGLSSGVKHILSHRTLVVDPEHHRCRR